MTKANKSKYDCLDKLLDHEPYFVLRAQDLSASYLVDSWVALNRDKVPEDKLHEAQAIADAMREWPIRKHAD